MAIDDLPLPVVNLLNVIGVPWPYINEDTVWQFAAGDVPGLPDIPPDFTGSDAEVAAGMASMDSPFQPAQATSIEPLA